MTCRLSSQLEHRVSSHLTDIPVNSNLYSNIPIMATLTVLDSPKSTAEALQEALIEYDRLFSIHDSRIVAYNSAHGIVHRSSAILYQLERGPQTYSSFPWLHENRKRYVFHLRTSAGHRMKEAREEVRAIRVELKRVKEVV